MNDNELFSQQHFHDAAQSRKESLVREISSYDMATVLAIPVEELAKYFEERFEMNPPSIKRDGIHLLDNPKEVATREQIGDRVRQDEYVNVNRNYIHFTVCVPFEGDASLFALRPNSYQWNMSRKMNATVHGSEIRLSYNELVEGGQPDLNSLYEGDVNMIAINLQRLSTDAQNFNRELPAFIRQKLNERKQSAEKNSSIIQSFKIPIKNGMIYLPPIPSPKSEGSRVL